MSEPNALSQLPTSNWFTPAWPFAPRVGVVTTSRHGNLSQGVYAGFNLAQHVGDDAKCVAANRRGLLQHYVPHGLDCIQWLDQVHGVDVLAADADSATLVPTADAAWTAVPGLGLAVLTADCLPVVLVSRDGSSIGIAHGGWRGLVAGVLPNLLQRLGPAATDYAAWIGPGIGARAYEIGEEVAEQVRACGNSEVLSPGRLAGKYQLDLVSLARCQLQSLGVGEIYQSGVCTVTNPGCYSYRRDGVTGRMATLVWLRSERAR